MNTIAIIIAIAAILCGGFFVYFQILAPWHRICAALSELTRRNSRPLNPLLHASPIFKECAGDIRTISQLLQQLNSQIMDEGFSLRAILSSMVEGVLIIDRSQRIHLVNEALMNLFSLTETPINHTVLEVFQKHELQQALEDVLEQRQPKKIELIFETETEKGVYQSRHFEIHVAALNDKNRSQEMSALMVFHDITTIRNLEAMRKEFLANVSHEFRTPLAIINGYVETLLDGAISDPDMLKRALKVMHQNGQRLSLLINDLLTISHLEDRAKVLEFRNVNLRNILEQVLDHLEPNLIQRNAKIEIDWPAEICEAQGDERRIEQVYSNLLSNALRYGEVENLVIRITARRESNEICIAFADNGPGIPLTDQAHIFERFYRVHKDRSRDAGGTGLGLSIVKNVVQAHGGRVSVESTPGTGATFHITIPITQGASLN